LQFWSPQQKQWVMEPSQFDVWTVDSEWLFAERLLYVDWIEERDLS
jgi:hypothetical protein